MKLQHATLTKRKQVIMAVGTAATLIGLLVFGLWVSDPNKDKPSLREQQREKAREVTKDFRTKNVVSDKENWMAKSEEKLAEQSQQIRDMSNSMRTIQKRLTALGIDAGTRAPSSSEEPDPRPPEPATDSPTPLDLFKPSAPGTVNSPIPAAPTPPLPVPIQQREASPVSPPSPQGQAGAIQVVDIQPGTDAQEKPKNVMDYLPAGSFASVRLLSGVDAPTGGEGVSNPIPVLLRVMTDGTLPNFFHSNVSSCHIVAAAHGSISSERAHILLTKLSCVLLNGDIIETDLNGYVTGEDGKAGLRGRLVSKQGTLIARSLLSGLASGFGRTLQQQSQQLATSPLGAVATVNPNQVFQAGAGAGISNALEKVADYYLQRANELYPIIEVAANRAGEAILIDGTPLTQPILHNTREEEEEEEEEERP